MELRTYWTIIWRRLWVIALVVGIVALYVGYQYYHLRASKSYSSNITLQIGLQPTSNGDQNSANYVTVSEDLADAMVAGPILTSHEFDKDISNQIGQDMSLNQQRFGANADLGDWQNTAAIGQAITAVRVHSLVTINTNWNTPAGAWAIANAIGEVSVAKLGIYLDYALKNDATQNSTSNFAPPQVSARVITAAPDPISVSGSSSNKVSVFLLMLLAALVLGIALTFLLDYLDDRIRSKDEIPQLLGIPIYAVIPHAPSPGRSRSPVPRK